MARLPAALEQLNTLANLRVGQVGWTVPWAMTVGPDRECWLNLRFTYEAGPYGTLEMRVYRKREGYCVDVSRTSYRWRVEDSKPHSSDLWAPVAEIYR